MNSHPNVLLAMQIKSRRETNQVERKINHPISSTVSSSRLVYSDEVINLLTDMQMLLTI